MRTLKNINPMGQVDVPVLGRQGEPFGEPGRGCLERGETVEVSDEVAGEAPFWRAATEDDVLEHFEVREVSAEDEDAEPELEVLDPGWGLLAQTDNWVEVKKSDPLKGLTVDELKKYAADHEIDLGEATTKADITAVIRKAV